MNAIPGLNSTLDEMQAAVLLARLPRLGQANARRREIAAMYLEHLDGLPLQFQKTDAAAFHVQHLFVVRTRERNALREHLGSLGIPSLSHYPVPMHHQPFMAASQQGPFPFAEDAANTCLSLPLYPSLPADDQDRVVRAVRGFFA